MADPDANIIFGAQIDDEMAGVLSITVVATGFSGQSIGSLGQGHEGQGDEARHHIAPACAAAGRGTGESGGYSVSTWPQRRRQQLVLRGAATALARRPRRPQVPAVEAALGEDGPQRAALKRTNCAVGSAAIGPPAARRRGRPISVWLREKLVLLRRRDDLHARGEFAQRLVPLRVVPAAPPLLLLGAALAWQREERARTRRPLPPPTPPPITHLLRRRNNRFLDLGRHLGRRRRVSSSRRHLAPEDLRDEVAGLRAAVYSRAARRRSKRPTTDASVDGAHPARACARRRRGAPTPAAAAAAARAVERRGVKGQRRHPARSHPARARRKLCSTKARSTAVASASPSTRRWCARARAPPPRGRCRSRRRAARVTAATRGGGGGATRRRKHRLPQCRGAAPAWP